MNDPRVQLSKLEKQALTLAIHWPRLGPYHLARLRAAQTRLLPKGVRVVALEIASHDETYGWRVETGPTAFERQVVFLNRTYDRIPFARLCSGLFHHLNCASPDVVAVNGYGFKDAWVLLTWCRIYRRPAILMTESKADDTSRVRGRERLKRLVVRQFSSALCGGSLHRAYLEQLGMRPGEIFEGYDVVDNDFFQTESTKARENPDAFRHLPGLEAPESFFLASARLIERKNLDGLLRAYGTYRRRCARGNAWRLVVLGNGVERQGLEAIIKEDGLEGVALPGFRQIDELPAYYGLAGAFIHPALQDQWGLVVNEAMASGIPVIVSIRCGCAPDLVREGENGFTFDPQDEEALASLMLRLSSGEVDLVKMGRAAQTHISHWGPERFAQGLEGALQIALR